MGGLRSEPFSGREFRARPGSHGQEGGRAMKRVACEASFFLAANSGRGRVRTAKKAVEREAQ